MKAFKKLVELIEEKMLEVGQNNIDYSEELEYRFCYDIYTYVEMVNNIIHFDFSAYDNGNGFKVDHVKFEQNLSLPNIIEKLNKTNFIYE